MFSAKIAFKKAIEQLVDNPNVSSVQHGIFCQKNRNNNRN